MLQVRNLSKYFGGLAALSKVDIDIRYLEILGVIGPNGAGKSTLFNVISGSFPPTSGKVVLDGKDITGLEAHKIAQLGINRTFQESTLFMDLSVLDNVFTGFHMSYRSKVWKRLFRTLSATEEEAVLKQRAIEILEFVGLGSVKDELAGALPHGHQKVLSVGIALATNPKLLLLDEPVSGMNQTEIQTMMDLVRQIRTKGITVAVVEHNMQAVMNLCDRIVVLSYGHEIAEGRPHEIRDNQEVIEAYLGKEEV